MKIIKNNIVLVVILLSVFIVGILTYKDYGISTDEPYQLQHTINSYRVYLKFLNIKEKGSGFKKLYNDNFVESKESPLYILDVYLNKYSYKYYGVAVQLPILLIDAMFKFKLSINILYYLRHLLTFLIYFISLIYFYRLANEYIFKNKKYAIITLLLFILSPRIYGEAFYNIKDLVFMSLIIINIYYAIRYINDDKLPNIIKLSAISALAINSRIFGGLVVFLAIIFKLFTKEEKKNKIVSIIKLILITYILFILITPYSWYNPILYPFESLSFFYNYSDPYSHSVNYDLYFNKWISSRNLPWHYLPVWIFITTPILYIILFIIGFIYFIYRVLKKDLNKNLGLLFVNTILIILLLFVIIFKPTMYGGWRHLYFIYPIIIINAGLAIKILIEKKEKVKYILYPVIIINFVVLIAFMIRNHPYQSLYFSGINRQNYSKKFEFDYYRIGNYKAFKYIEKIDKRDNVKVYASYNKSSLLLLNSNKIQLVYDNKYNQADYLIVNSNDNYTVSKNYKAIKSKYIDGTLLYTIYKNKKTDD